MIQPLMDRKGEGRVLAVTPTIWPFFPSPSLSHGDPLYVMKILPLHWATGEPLRERFFWALWVRTPLKSSDSFQLPFMATEHGWEKVSKQQPNTTEGLSWGSGTTDHLELWHLNLKVPWILILRRVSLMHSGCRAFWSLRKIIALLVTSPS